MDMDQSASTRLLSSVRSATAVRFSNPFHARVRRRSQVVRSRGRPRNDPPRAFRQNHEAPVCLAGRDGTSAMRPSLNLLHATAEPDVCVPSRTCAFVFTASTCEAARNTAMSSRLTTELNCCA
eukprot:2227938-Pleurochrysis_carterae.AAC.2